MTTKDAASFASVSDKVLVRLAKDGDASAFVSLSERYMPVLKSRANRYSNVVGVDVEDFVQEGMLALFRAVKGYDAGTGIQFSTYAITCINNSMTTTIKSHMKTITGAKIPYNPDSAQQNPTPVEDLFIEREDSAELLGQIEALLSEFERQVMKLYLRGLSYMQIAQLLSSTTKAVDNALQRVRRKLRPKVGRNSPINQP